MTKLPLYAAGLQARKVRTMKKLILVSVLGAVGSLAMAQEVGRVISSTPVVQQYPVPRQVCNNTQVLVQQPKSGGGALLGAVAGGAAGNAIGDGGGRAIATLIGLVGGALVGDRIEGDNAPQYQNVQQCGNQTFYENRTVAYNVVYEFAGKQYQVQMPNDPGPTVQLQVTPVGGAPSQYGQPQQPYAATPGYPGQVYYPAPATAPAYPVYQRPYYSPIGLSLNLGFSNSRGHWR